MLRTLLCRLQSQRVYIPIPFMAQPSLNSPQAVYVCYPVMCVCVYINTHLQMVSDLEKQDQVIDVCGWLVETDFYDDEVVRRETRSICFVSFPLSSQFHPSLFVVIFVTRCVMIICYSASLTW